MFTAEYKTEIGVSHCNIHLKVDKIITNLFNSMVSAITDNYCRIARVHTAPIIYGGDVRELLVMCGKVEPLNIANGTFFLNFEPTSPNYKKLFLYYNGTPHEFEYLDDYFSYTP